MYRWEDLMEIRQQTLEVVVEWLVAHGEREEDIEWDGDHTPIATLLALPEDDDYRLCPDLHVGGYWSDEHLIIEFEDGIVRRWYRSWCWD